MTSGTLAYTPLGHEIEYTSLTLGISRIPVLDGRILNLGILLYNNLHHCRMKLVFITHRSSTSLHVTHIRALIRHNQRPLELSCSCRIYTEITRQFHRAAHPFRNIHERTVTEHGRIERRIEVISHRHHRSQIFLHKVRMFTNGLRERAENYPFLCKRSTESRSHRYGIENRIYGHTGQSRPLMKRNAQFVECLFQFRIYLLRTVLISLGSRIIYYILKVNLRNIKMCPLRERHLLPAAESIQTELKHPLRLLLLRRDQAYDILVQTLGYEFLLDIGDEAVLILLVREAV